MSLALASLISEDYDTRAQRPSNPISTMFLALSSFSNELGAVLELLTLECRFGPYPCFGLIRSDEVRLRSNIWLFLLGWATAISTICTCTAELHVLHSLIARSL